MADTTYNGWSNYETWLVSLWLDNDLGTYDLMREMARECVEEYHVDVLHDDHNAKIVSALSDRIEDYIEDANPLAEQATVFTDLLTSALGVVNWREIAKNILIDIGDNSAPQQ